MSTPDTYMSAKQVHKLTNVLMQCMMVVHDMRTTFDGKTFDEIGDWVREQLNGCGFPSQPMGMTHVRLFSGLFEEAEIPAPVLDELIGWKALAMDYKYMLDVIAARLDSSSDLMAQIAEQTENSRQHIDKAKKKRAARG